MLQQNHRDLLWGGERKKGSWEGGNEIPCQFGMRHELSLLSEGGTSNVRIKLKEDPN